MTMSSLKLGIVCRGLIQPRSMLDETQVLNEDIGQQGAQYTAYTQLVVHTNGSDLPDLHSLESDGISGKKLGAVAGAIAGAVAGALATKLVAKL